MRRLPTALVIVLLCAFAPHSTLAEATSEETTESSFPPEAAPSSAPNPNAVEASPPVIITPPVILEPGPDLARGDASGETASARFREQHAPSQEVAKDLASYDAYRETRKPKEGSREGSPPRDASNAAVDPEFEYYDAHEYAGYSTTSIGTGNEYAPTSKAYWSWGCAPHNCWVPAIGAGSPLPYPRVVRGVHAPLCLVNHPPTCTCFGPFTFIRPWGYYCVLVPGNAPSPPPPVPSPPVLGIPPPPPPPSPPSVPPAPREACGFPISGFSCDAKPPPLGSPCGFCVFVDGVRTCCCDALCQSLGDCCSDYASCCSTTEQGAEEVAFGLRMRAAAERLDGGAGGAQQEFLKKNQLLKKADVDAQSEVSIKRRAAQRDETKERERTP